MVPSMQVFLISILTVLVLMGSGYCYGRVYQKFCGGLKRFSYTFLGTFSIIALFQIWVFFAVHSGFCTNVFSPGVGYRRSVKTGMGIFPAIGSSIISAVTSLEEYSTLIVVLLFFPVVFLTIYSVRGADYNFHYPVLFTLFSFGVYAAQCFPSWYSIGTEGEQRALSICHNLYFWLILLNCILLVRVV